MSSGPAVILLSGGLDSATCAAIAKAEGFDLFALTIYYQQRHKIEIECARRVAEFLRIKRHVEQSIDLRCFGGSALTDDIAVPKGRTAEEMAGEIPITYVPARNTIFLSYALAFAEVVGSADLFIGVNALDYSGYPDCRPEYISAFETMANLATKAGIEGRRLTIHTPLVRLSKSEIIRRGVDLDFDYSLTSSCYDPSPEGEACGECDSCQLRLKGFREAGIPDPIRYRES